MFKDRLSRLGLGLEDRMKSKVGLLSGGQRQALTLLMAHKDNFYTAQFHPEKSGAAGEKIIRNFLEI